MQHKGIDRCSLLQIEPKYGLWAVLFLAFLSLSSCIDIRLPSMGAKARLPTAEPIEKLDIRLPIIGNYRVVDDRYLIGFDQGYAEIEDALVILDMSSPLEPKEVVRWQWGDEIGTCYLQFDGDYVYKHCYGSDKFSAVDLSDLLHPVLLPSKNEPFVFDEFIVHEGLMYTLQNDDSHHSTLTVWDLTNFEKIHQIESLRIPTRGYELLIHSGYLLFASVPHSFTDNSVLYVVDVNDPDEIVVVDEYVGENDFEGGGYLLRVKGKYLYADQIDIGLRVIDISNPKRLHQIGIYDERNMVVRDMEITDDFLYMVGDFRFRIADVSNPRRPRLVMQADLRAYDIAVINGYVYILESLGDGTFVYQAWGR